MTLIIPIWGSVVNAEKIYQEKKACLKRCFASEKAKERKI
jgi:hypothetical protein